MYLEKNDIVKVPNMLKPLRLNKGKLHTHKNLGMDKATLKNQGKLIKNADNCT